MILLLDMTQGNSSNKIQQLVEKTYGNRYRLRVNGLILKDDSLLMVKNLGVGPKGYLWTPPGGEPAFGEKLEIALEREVFEETGILSKTKEFRFFSEYINLPLHAVELFFLVDHQAGELKLGTEPELGKSVQGLGDVKWLSFDEINEIHRDEKHQIFRIFDSKEKLLAKSGFIQL